MSRHSRQAGASLYVRNISDRVRYEDLKRLFSKHGRIVDITIPLDYHTRDPKGFAFIEFEDPRDAEDAMRYLDRYRLHNKELEIEFARGDRKTPSEMRLQEKEFQPAGNDRGGSRGGPGGRGNYGGGRGESRRRPSRSRSRSRGGARRERSFSRERSSPRHGSRQKKSRSESQ